MRQATRRRRLILLLLVCLALPGCGRQSRLPDQAPEVTIALAADPNPPLLGRLCWLVIELKDAAGAPIDGARVLIQGDMTHPGMVPVRVQVEGGEGGLYQTPFDWTMAGDWVVTVTATLPDGRITARQFALTVEIPGG